MEFTNAYNKLKQLNISSFRYDYHFQNAEISLLANLDQGHDQLFILITTPVGEQVCKQLLLTRSNNNKINFSGYWSAGGFNLIYPYLSVDNKLKSFWLDLIEHVLKLSNSTVTPIPLQEVKKQVNSTLMKSSSENIYPHYLINKNMSPQREKKFHSYLDMQYIISSNQCTVRLH